MNVGGSGAEDAAMPPSPSPSGVPRLPGAEVEAGRRGVRWNGKADGAGAGKAAPRDVELRRAVRAGLRSATVGVRIEE